MTQSIWSPDTPRLSRTTQLLIDTHKENIAIKLGEVERLLGKFAHAIRNPMLAEKRKEPIRPVVVFAPKDECDYSKGFTELDTAPSRQLAATAYAQIEYRDQDLANQSIKCFGAVGVPHELLDLARVINRTKKELREAIRPVANRQVKIPGKDPTGNRTVIKRELTTFILRQIQRSSYNLLAAYRELPILEQPVHKVRLMLTRTRSVPRKTVAEIMTILANNPGRLGTADLDKLRAYVATDPARLREYLVSPKRHYFRMRAKVYYQRTRHGKQLNEIVSAELPLLLPMTPSSTPPLIFGPTPPDTARPQPTARIESEEFVTSLHYYQMRPEFRQYAKG